MRFYLKTFVFALFFIIIIPFFTKTAFAHPLDLTNLDLYVKKDNTNKKVPENKIAAKIFISWPEALFLLKQSEEGGSNDTKKLTNILSSKDGALTPEDFGLSSDDPLSSLGANPKPYQAYIEKNVVISNNGKNCTPQFITIPTQDINEVLFGKGMRIDYLYTCPDPVNEIKIIDSLFTKEFAYQVNIVNVYEDNSGNAIKGGFLRPKDPVFTVVLSSEEGPKARPVSLTSNPFTGSLLKNFSEVAKGSLLFAIVIVFLVGVVHTFEAGHSKTILATSMIDHKMSYRQSFFYVGVFVLTHIADILILGALLLIAASFVDIYSKLSLLQSFSIYALFFISLYMLLEALTKLIRQKLNERFNLGHGDDLNGHTHDLQMGHTHSHSTAKNKKNSHKKGESRPNLRKQLMLGFLAGISPCLMGWSIFLVILSTQKVWTLFPVILAFAAGIATTLLIFAFVVVKFKNTVFSKLPWIGELSPIISSLVLVIYSLLLLM